MIFLITLSKDGFPSRHETESEVAVRVDLVPITEDGDVVKEMLPTLETADRILGRSERDLGRAAAEIERDETLEQVFGEDVQLSDKKIREK